MAFLSVKQGQMPHDAPGVGDFGRNEIKDYFIGNGQECELFVATVSGGTVAGSIPTGFEQVKGGYAVDTATGLASSVVDVKPGATDPAQADITAIPANGVYLFVIFGFKNPNALT